jgi:hypothetical protein
MTYRIIAAQHRAHVCLVFLLNGLSFRRQINYLDLVLMDLGRVIAVIGGVPLDGYQASSWGVDTK